jgi:hypothetical protein
VFVHRVRRKCALRAYGFCAQIMVSLDVPYGMRKFMKMWNDKIIICAYDLCCAGSSLWRACVRLTCAHGLCSPLPCVRLTCAYGFDRNLWRTCVRLTCAYGLCPSSCAYVLHVRTALPSAPLCVQCTACEAITLMSVDEWALRLWGFVYLRQW